MINKKIVLMKNGDLYISELEKDDFSLLKKEDILKNMYSIFNMNDDCTLETFFKMIEKYPDLMGLNEDFDLIMNEYNESKNIKRENHKIIDYLLYEKHIIEDNETMVISKGISGLSYKEDMAEVLFTIIYEKMEHILDLPFSIGSILIGNEITEEYSLFNYFDLTLSEFLDGMSFDLAYGDGRKNKEKVQLEAIEEKNKSSRFKVIK